MNTRTLHSFLKSINPRLVQIAAFVCAFAIPVFIVWGVKKLDLVHPQVEINPNSQAAKNAARIFFEPPRPASEKPGDFVRPPVSVLPSAYQRFELDLDQKRQQSIQFPGTARANMSQIANCVTSPVLPHNEKIRCLFAANEIYKAVSKGKGKDPILDTEFDRAKNGADPFVRNHVEQYYAMQKRVKKKGK